MANLKRYYNKKCKGQSELKIMKFSKETAKLFQTSNDGSELVWQGTLKPDVKYGKGKTLYLEIAPQDEPCDQVTYKRCLMVREIIYNEQASKPVKVNGTNSMRKLKVMKIAKPRQYYSCETLSHTTDRYQRLWQLVCTRYNHRNQRTGEIIL